MKRSSLVHDQANSASGAYDADGARGGVCDGMHEDMHEDMHEEACRGERKDTRNNSSKKPRKHSRKEMQSPRNAAMNLLARREHSLRELQQKLARRFDKHELDLALAKLSDENLQSDQRFAQSFTRERMLRGIGPLRIESELRQRGVQRQIIDHVLVFVPEDEGFSWRSVAKGVLQRKFGDERPVDVAEKSKRLRFLAYRGFGEESAGLVPDVA